MGMQKRLRSAAKANYAMEHGFYYHADDPWNPQKLKTFVSAGVIRAAERLAEHRRLTELRLNPPKPQTTVVEKIAGAIETVKKAVRKPRAKKSAEALA